MATTKKKKPTIADKIKAVNAILKKGEPENISVDPYTKYTGYSPQYIVDAMNAVMFGEWGFIEISNDLVDKNDEGKPQMAVAQVEVYIKNEDGIDAVYFRPRAYGQSRVTRGDFGDARKGAQTDAIKKALSYFSIGNRAYHGKLTTE